MTDVIKDMKSCEESGIMDAKLGKNFSTTSYDLRIYTGGMYFFEAEGENWDGLGIGSLIRHQCEVGLTSS